MDHQTALNSQAVERYTLGELTSPEREEFEEHFFECTDCADTLKEHEAFAVNVRAVLKEDDAAAAKPVTARAASATATAQPNWWTGGRKWFTVPAIAFAGMVLAFVMLRDPASTPDPKGERAEWTLDTASRAEVEPHAIAKTTVWVSPIVELEGLDPKRWLAYHWEVRDSRDKLVAVGNGAEKPLRLNIPAARLAPDERYVLMVQGARGTEPVYSRFAITRK